MESLDFGSLIIVGALVSLFTQFIKNVFGTSKTGTLLAVVAFSLVSGGLYVALRDTSYFETVVQILIASGAVYAFVLSRLETK